MLRELRDWLEEMACRAGLDGLPPVGRLARYAVIAAVVVAIGWTAIGAGQQPPGAAPPSGETSPTADATQTPPSMPASVTVHVVGEVRRPGVYVLRSGARACDAVDAAGGLLGDAEQASVNLARVVADGEQIVVPRQGQGAGAGQGPGGAAGTGAAGGKVDINTATAEQLDALPGVGPATATKIISDRTSNGPFSSVDDLMRVPGIGPAKFDALKDLITAN